MTMRRIPVTETLELVMRLTSDSLEMERIRMADREELIQHVLNLAVVEITSMGLDDNTERRARILAAQFDHVRKEAI